MLALLSDAVHSGCTIVTEQYTPQRGVPSPSAAS